MTNFAQQYLYILSHFIPVGFILTFEHRKIKNEHGEIAVFKFIECVLKVRIFAKDHREDSKAFRKDRHNICADF